MSSELTGISHDIAKDTVAGHDGKEKTRIAGAHVNGALSGLPNGFLGHFLGFFLLPIFGWLSPGA
jgi:hypothetical protein